MDGLAALAQQRHHGAGGHGQRAEEHQPEADALVALGGEVGDHHAGSGDAPRRPQLGAIERQHLLGQRRPDELGDPEREHGQGQNGAIVVTNAP